MQRRKIQSMLGMLMASAIALPVLAQVTQNPANDALPPLALPVVPGAGSAPVAPGLPTLPPMPSAPAPLAPTAVPATPVVPQNAPAAPAAVAAPAPAASVRTLFSSPVTAQPQDGGKTYSYGDSSLSILFTPTQIDQMKTAVRTYENASHNSTSTTFVGPTSTATVASPTALMPAIAEPASYPVFYLASIAYDSPKEWSLWVSGHKITSRKNDTDLTVIRVNAESVTFSWTPMYVMALTERRTQKLFAPVDPVKNRLLSTQPINFNETNGTVTFTLKTNQSFAVGYFRIFEGFMTTPSSMPAVATKSAISDEAEPVLLTSPPPTTH